MIVWMANVPQRVPPDELDQSSRPFRRFALLSGQLSETARWHTRHVMVAFVWFTFVEGVSGAMAGFANTYFYISATTGGAFTPALNEVNAAYFAIGTLSTAGTGRISAVSSGAQLTLIVQMAADVILVVIVLGFVVARLLALHAKVED